MKRFLGEDFLSTSNIKATKKNIIFIHAISSTRNGDLSFQEKLAKSIPKTRSMVGIYGKYFIDFYLLEYDSSNISSTVLEIARWNNWLFLRSLIWSDESILDKSLFMTFIAQSISLFFWRAGDIPFGKPKIYSWLFIIFIEILVYIFSHTSPHTLW